MVALVIAEAFLEKFGGDSLGETRANFDGYVARVAGRFTAGSGRRAGVREDPAAGGARPRGSGAQPTSGSDS
jgi:hypothetical protein